ncbi:MAG TPA: hypothetical protein DDY77_03805, partial [Clostridiales bacterium]|nr:hypothetical protein [Clostridiales bacterium]
MITYNKKLAIFLSVMLALVSISVLALSGFFRPIRLEAHADEASDAINSMFRIDGTKTNFLQGNDDVMFSSYVDLDMHLVSDDDENEDSEYFTMTFELGLKNTELYWLRSGAISEFYFDFYRLNEDEQSVASGCTLLSRTMFYANRYEFATRHQESVKNKYTVLASKDYVYSDAEFSIDPSQEFRENSGSNIAYYLGEQYNKWKVKSSRKPTPFDLLGCGLTWTNI